MSATLWTWLSDFSADFLTINHYKKPAEIVSAGFYLIKLGVEKPTKDFQANASSEVPKARAPKGMHHDLSRSES